MWLVKMRSETRRNHVAYVSTMSYICTWNPRGPGRSPGDGRRKAGGGRCHSTHPGLNMAVSVCNYPGITKVSVERSEVPD